MLIKLYRAENLWAYVIQRSPTARWLRTVTISVGRGWWACSFGTNVYHSIFRLYITFSLSQIPQPRNAPVQLPAWLPQPFMITCLPCLPSFALLIHRTIGPALRMECTGDLQTSLLHFPFRTGPHVVFLMIIFFSDLLIRHRDMRQFPPVTQLAPTRADRFQVIAPLGKWVRRLLPFRREWSLFSFFLDKSFCI